MHARRIGFGVLFLTLGAGCGGGGTPGSSTSGTTTSKVGAGNISATIDGAAWTSSGSNSVVTASSKVPGELTIEGLQGSAANYTSLELILGFLTGPGTYPFGVNQGSTPGGTASVITVASASSFSDWMTDFSGMRGTITFATLAGGHMTGTFAFTAPPEAGSTLTNTRTVTDGTFDLDVPSGFLPASGDGIGSTMTATLDGQPWVGATVEGVGDPASGVLSITAMTSGVSLTLVTTTPVAAGGTYDQTAISIQATGTGDDCCWGGSGGTLSLTITSLTATRAAGSFSASIPVLAGGNATAPLTITSGAFDVAIQPAS